uniref:Specifically androgen-regulated gene protein n=1 Tax=Paramormyrops kingsleyae TaxID=1676925 RepID=A0A3B3QK50_9TELE
MVGFNSTPVSVDTPISQVWSFKKIPGPLEERSNFTVLSILRVSIPVILNMQVTFLVYVFQKNDNLGHLSPEEWECLMFLEKTIESLEAEENIELSIDNADRLPFVAGSLAAKKDQVPSLMVMVLLHSNPPSNRVATPLVLVMDGQPKVGPKLSPGKLDSCIKAAADSVNEEVSPGTQSETKAAGSPTVGTTQATQNDPASDFTSPRGPLSYEELVQIRMSASVKSAHTFSMFNKTHTPVTEDSCSDTSYLATSPSEKIIMDPLRVRKEALRKLGLLKSDEANPDTLIGVAHSRRPRQSSEPGLCHHDPELPKRTPGKTQWTPNVQSATSAPSNPSPASIAEIKSATLGRFSLGAGGSTAENVAINLRNSRPRPSSLGNQKDFEDIHEVRQKPTAAKALGLSEAVRQPHSVSVVIKPYCQLGDDRQEALRKLGLLKN